MLEGIEFAKEKMFTMEFKTLVNIRDTKTGSVIYGPPQSISIILYPIETRMAELVRVTSSTIDSIQIWRNKLKEQELIHIKIISDYSQVKFAQKQITAAKWNIGIQIIVILFTVFLVAYHNLY